MRTAGTWLAILGGIGLIGSVMIDVSVPDGMGGRVNNLGLMNDQRNYLLISGLMVLIGVILIVTDRSPKKAKAAPPPPPLPHGIEEEDGLFVWGGKAFASRNEAEAYVKQRLAEHAARATGNAKA